METANFSDLRRTVWLPTLKLNTARFLMSGLLLGIVFFIFSGQSGLTISERASALLLGPLYVLIGVPIAYGVLRVLAWIMRNTGIGLAALAADFFVLIFSVIPAVADPIIFLINKNYPQFFNCPDLGVINFHMVILVTN